MNPVPNLDYVQTTCPYCGTGCSLYLVVKDGKVVGTAPYDRSPVNEGRICQKGKYAHEFINSPDRLKTPLIRKNGELVSATWEEALDIIVKKAKETKPDEFAVIGSARASNEDNYALQKLARIVFKTVNIDNCARLCHASTIAGLGQVFGTGATTNSVADIADARCIFIIGSNSFEAHPLIGRKIMQAKQNGARIIVADPRRTPTARQADIHLPLFPGTDIALLNGMMRVIINQGWEDTEYINKHTNGFDVLKKCVTQEKYSLQNVSRVTGVPADDIVTAVTWMHEAPVATLLYTLGITQHTVGVDNVRCCGYLQLLLGNLGKRGGGVNPLRGQNNVQGACDMGVLPDVFPGYQKVTDSAVIKKFEKTWGYQVGAGKVGLTIPEMFDSLVAEPGRLKFLYMVGKNPLVSDPDIHHTLEGLYTVGFFVLQDIFRTEIAEYADVVLPAVCFAEKDGTQTSTERRVQRFKKAQDGPGDAADDWKICTWLATRMGFWDAFLWNSASEVFDEMAALTPQYTGMNYDRIKAEGLQWPCPTPGHPGTEILHTETFSGMPGGKAVFGAIEHRPPDEVPDDEYPIILTTGATIWHWTSGSMTRRSPSLVRDCPTGWIEVNTKDAGILGIKNGEMVQVSSRRGTVGVRAKVTSDIKKGVMFMPFHFWECRANWLTNSARDPVSKTPEYKACAIKVEKIQA